MQKNLYRRVLALITSRGRVRGTLALGMFTALSGALWACLPRPTPTSMAGCGSDRDCKLDRICVQSQCVWPGGLDAGVTVAKPENIIADAGGEAGAEPPAGALTMFRFEPQHRGRVGAILPTNAPQVLWKYATGGPITSSPAIGSDGTIVVGSHDGMIHVVQPNGTLRWKQPTGDVVFGSAAVDLQGNVLIGSGDDHLYKLDATRNALAWRVKLGNCKATLGVGPEASRCDVDGGPTVGSDGTIYVGGSGVFALSSQGKTLWQYATTRRVPTAPALHPAGFLVAGGHDDTLFALSLGGQKLWDFRAGDDIESSPMIADDGTIYFGSDDQKIYALSPTGGLLWAFVTKDDVRASPALGRNGQIIVGGFDGLLYVMSPDGTLAWTFRAADRIVSSALVDARGAILFGAQDDRLYALEPDGTLRWSVELGGDIDSSPTVGPDGTIYVGCDDKNLYALRGE
ncbi:MAG: PQQ-binding-like beta-propeller repeat protein [Deltaproteobacteria bacterium]|nr:PQQ-binding-like beta-propeller repeat protein [Deltaproteobacteria bacterium]